VVPRPFVPAPPAEEFRDLDLPILAERPARTAAFSAALERRRKEDEAQREREEREQAKEKEPEKENTFVREPEVSSDAEHGQTASPAEETVAQEPPVLPAQSPAQPQQLPEEPEQQVLLTEEGNPVAQETPQWRMAGEVLDTYIIVEQGEKVFFIDKHAAHERMNFDRLKRRDYQPMPQLLLSPLVYSPPPEEAQALLEQKTLLERFGFEVEDFGSGALIVRQVPDYLGTGEVESTLAELARKILTTGTADPTAVRDEVLHTMACMSAIKGGWKNDRQELEVVARAVMSGEVKYCPHGRPVAIELTKKQLEKQFKRT
jgi:DNA mismatch repair protein MutL